MCAWYKIQACAHLCWGNQRVPAKAGARAGQWCVAGLTFRISGSGVAQAADGECGHLQDCDTRSAADESKFPGLSHVEHTERLCW